MSISQSGAAEDGGEPTSPACLVEDAPLAFGVSPITTDSVAATMQWKGGKCW